MLRYIPLFAAAALLGFWSAAPAQEGQSVVIQDFEKDLEITPYPEGAKFEYSADWAAEGKRSMHLFQRTMVAISDMTTHDWSGYQLFRIHTKVPGTSAVALGIELADENNVYLNRHQNTTSAPPGVGTVDIDISGDLWRGEVNRPYRLLKTPINKAQITRFAVTAQSGDIYIDRIELVKVTPITAPGAFAFDFGRAGGVVQGQWIGINPATQWDDKKGYGLTSGAIAFDKDTPYPTPVMGDGINFGDARLEVNLAGGKYLGWVIYERSGFWEHQQAQYKKASLLVNDKVVTSHDTTPDNDYFQFQDLEAFTQDDIVKMVLDRQKVSDFTFDAANGKNQIALKVEGVIGEPVRLAGLVLAPDNLEGRAFIEAHKRLQTETIAKVHRLLDRAQRAGDPAKATTTLIVAPLAGSDAVMHPGDWPALTASQEIPAIDALAGASVPRAIGVYAKAECSVGLKVSDLTGDAGTMPASAVSILSNRYLPTHGYDQTACWIESHHYRPADKIQVSPTVARAVLLLVNVPAGTKPGTYRGTLSLSPTAGNAVAEAQAVPIVVNVSPGTLPPIDFPSALFFSGVQMSKEAIGEELYWKLGDSMLQQMQRAGFTFVTGGPSFSVKWNGDTPVYEGADALKWLKMAKGYGLDRAIVNYGGLHAGISRGSVAGHGNLTEEQTAAALFKAWDAFRKANGLPEYYVNSYDEPGTDAEFANVERFLKVVRQAGFKTIGWTSMANPDQADAHHKMLAKETVAPAFNIHSRETLKYVKDLGNEPWIYNQGLDRSSSGMELFQSHRAGAVGRVQWIAAIIQGFQYDALDGREPDLSCFYFHKDLGVLMAPRFLGTLEGGIDARLLFELERRAKAGAANAAQINALIQQVEAHPYRRNMTTKELDDLRARMVALLQESSPK